MSDALAQTDLTKLPPREFDCPSGSKAGAPIKVVPVEVDTEGRAIEGETGALINWPPTLYHDMQAHDTKVWEIRNGANNDRDMFASIFRPNMVRFADGFLSLTVGKCRSNCDGFPYASAEYRSVSTYHYGYYEARMKPAKGAGLMAGSFFTFTGEPGTASHHEIDLEFVGAQTNKVQLNYYVNGQGNHETPIELGFDASQAFHNYGFMWTKNRLVFYVDGRQVHAVTATKSNPLPSAPGQIILNLWRGADNAEMISWLGGPYNGGRATAVYDWIKYAPLDSQP